ncbi:hypothetical protein JKP88DRAFT_297207 [Tribonema minus]|uniref:Uncharacterized protein n=1 Tax=Tribonema minus TaxID=303371 RepID=A0A835ZGX1_9STRA|nr:hypothetical protein JKP88DRAFT_297207 [Tribonema minus]
MQHGSSCDTFCCLLALLKLPRSCLYLLCSSGGTLSCKLFDNCASDCAAAAAASAARNRCCMSASSCSGACSKLSLALRQLHGCLRSSSMCRCQLSRRATAPPPPPLPLLTPPRSAQYCIAVARAAAYAPSQQPHVAPGFAAAMLPHWRPRCALQQTPPPCYAHASPQRVPQPLQPSSACGARHCCELLRVAAWSTPYEQHEMRAPPLHHGSSSA